VPASDLPKSAAGERHPGRRSCGSSRRPADFQMESLHNPLNCPSTTSTSCDKVILFNGEHSMFGPIATDIKRRIDDRFCRRTSGSTSSSTSPSRCRSSSLCLTENKQISCCRSRRPGDRIHEVVAQRKHNRKEPISHCYIRLGRDDFLRSYKTVKESRESVRTSCFQNRTEFHERF
jgi:hypothetical protein